MCRYNMSFNDAIMNEIRPYFKDEESMVKWMQVSMEHLMLDIIAQFKNPDTDGKQLLSKLNALPDTPESFLQLGGILGSQRENFSWDELREDAYQSDYSHDEQIYRQVKALEGDSHALSKLGAILKPSPYSAEELLDEYVGEKYGISVRLC